MSSSTKNYVHIAKISSIRSLKMAISGKNTLIPESCQ